MVQKTQKNMENQPKCEEKLQLKTFVLDAKNINSEELSEDCVIATE